MSRKITSFQEELHMLRRLDIQQLFGINVSAVAIAVPVPVIWLYGCVYA